VIEVVEWFAHHHPQHHVDPQVWAGSLNRGHTPADVVEQLDVWHRYNPTRPATPADVNDLLRRQMARAVVTPIIAGIRRTLAEQRAAHETAPTPAPRKAAS
jgi:hypothetical protein